MKIVARARIDTSRLAPCGYCRRCAIHDDPGGCLEVEAYEREMFVRWGFTVQDLTEAVRREGS